MRARHSVFETANAGTTKEWYSPRTGSSGAIKLARMFELKGMSRRAFNYITWTKHHSSETRVTVDWCKVTNEGWNLVGARDGHSD